MIAQGDRAVIMRYIEICRELPPPGETFLAADLLNIDSNIVGQRLSKLRDHGIVEKVDVLYTDGTRLMVWETTDQGWTAISEILAGSESAVLPCGHGGFVNPRDRDGLQCKVCEAIWSVDEVRA